MRNKQAFSLVEMLVVIAVIGIISAITIPVISNIREASIDSKTRSNAKNIEQMSGALASLGVAHVIPDSLGGVEATARLLREGVVVPEGPMAGELYSLPGLDDDEIALLSELLRIEYDMREIRLVFRQSDDSVYNFHKNMKAFFCFTAPRFAF